MLTDKIEELEEFRRSYKTWVFSHNYLDRPRDVLASSGARAALADLTNQRRERYTADCLTQYQLAHNAADLTRLSSARLQQTL